MILWINCRDSKKIPLISIRTPFAITDIPKESLNKELKAKDIIIALDGQKTRYLDQVKTILEKNKNKTITAIVFKRSKRIACSSKSE